MSAWIEISIFVRPMLLIYDVALYMSAWIEIALVLADFGQFVVALYMSASFGINMRSS